MYAAGALFQYHPEHWLSCCSWFYSDLQSAKAQIISSLNHLSRHESHACNDASGLKPLLRHFDTGTSFMRRSTSRESDSSSAAPDLINSSVHYAIHKTLADTSSRPSPYSFQMLYLKSFPATNVMLFDVTTLLIVTDQNTR